jgi:D-alanyl-D-alanine carboxypeptidase
MIVVEASSGKVIFSENATYPWYPASTTKLMTMYVALKAVKEGRLRLDSLLTVSPVAAAEPPSKMGFPAGITVTLENALAMTMVKSANDMAAVVAEGVGGSIEGFAAMMNANAQRLGMTQSNFVNPNGLPDDNHVSSARDMAILARAIITDLPEYEYFTHIPAIKFGRRITRNFNSLIGRYPGADGMKTGFVCASGFNLVASATRNGRRLIVVVFGAPSSPVRAAKAAALLEKGFGSGGGFSLFNAGGRNVASLEPVTASPPNLRDDMCGPKRKRPVIASDDDNAAIASGPNGTESGDSGFSLFAATNSTGGMKPSEMLAMAPAAAQPMIVYAGPKKTGADLIAADAIEEAKQTPKKRVAKKKNGKKELKLDIAAKPDAKPAAKPAAAAKPKHAAVTTGTKPAAKPAAKPATAAAKPAAAKPAVATAKPKQAAAKDAKN